MGAFLAEINFILGVESFPFQIQIFFVKWSTKRNIEFGVKISESSEDSSIFSKVSSSSINLNISKSSNFEIIPHQYYRIREIAFRNIPPN